MATQTKKQRMTDCLLGREALHTAWIVENLIAKHLLEHPAIEQNKKWKKQAKKAHRAAFDLYQMIGADTLP